MKLINHLWALRKELDGGRDKREVILEAAKLQ